MVKLIFKPKIKITFMPTNTVIFDLGGVLIDWNPRYLYRKVFQDEARMEYFFRTYLFFSLE